MRKQVLLSELLPHEKEVILQELLDRLGYSIYLVSESKVREVEIVIEGNGDGTR